MKQAFNVNIGGRAYNIDEDAYELLDKYLNDISSRLADADMDSMDDIESRIVDIFDEKISSQMQVINIDMVRRVMAVIGRPEMFGGQKRGFSYQQTDYPHEPRKLYRSTTNKVIAGICGGLGEYFNVDPNVLRVIAAILFFITFSTCSVVYIILWIVLPKAPDYINYDRDYRRR